MRRVIVFACGLAVLCGLSAAPVPKQADVQALVAGLSNPSEQVRDECATALKNRADALPWLRRAARSTDKDTARRVAELLAPYEKKRQEGVAKVIDACLRDNHIDMFMEWHHYWQPENKDDLWSVMSGASKAGLELFAKAVSPEEYKNFEWRSQQQAMPSYFYDGPIIERLKTPKLPPGVKGRPAWCIRTDCIESAPSPIRFASINGPSKLPSLNGHYFTLGTVQTRYASVAFLVCDGDCTGWISTKGVNLGYTTHSMIICRGTFYGADITRSVILVDGDVDLSRGRPELKDSVIRASGEIRIHPDNKPENCTIEANVNNPTAPYKFFEFRDVGLHAAVDAKECAVANLIAIGTAGLHLSMSPTRAVYDLIVTDAKADTPIGNCGLAKGDRIRAIDDVRFESPDDFRKKLRRAMVRQGDCLLTVVRGEKTFDLPVFFPMPK